MSSARRVIFFVNSLGGGGAEAHTLRVMNHLDRRRWQPILAVARRGGSFEPFLAEDIRVHALTTGKLRSSVGQILLSLGGLRRLIRAENAAIVCAVMELAGLATIAATTALRRRPAVAICVQVPPLPKYGGSRLGRMVILPGIRRLYPRADGIIALSHGVKSELAQIQPSLASLTRVINNACVDERVLSAIHAASGPLGDAPEPRGPIVLAAGRLSPEKNFVRLVEAFGQVLRDVRAELWILGEGPERGAIEQRVAALGLGESVRLLGFRDNPQDFMRRATVFALSSHYEGFGNVIVEALACGTPVVATDCPYGPGEILTDGSGLLVPPDDATALAQAISKVLTDGDLRSRLCAAGPRRAAAFHASAIAAQYADELDRLVAAQRVRS